MMRSQQPRIAVVRRETRLKTLLNRWATRGQAKFVFRRARAAAAVQAGDMAAAVEAQSSAADEDFDELEQEDDTYETCLKQLVRELDFGLPVQVLDRAYLPTVDFDLCAVVVVVGQDGLVANSAKYVGETPIVGVNPDPARYDGVLLPFRVDDARHAVQNTLQRRARTRPVTLAQATLHDGQRLLAFNDLFIGVRSHVSARYQLRIGGRSEQQSSSGLLVSTGAGSTGWMSSVFNMACGVMQSLGQPVSRQRVPTLRWEDPRLLWAVREPFRSQSSGADLVAGQIAEGELIEVESLTSQGGVIFSDGVESDFLEFNGGTIARIGVAPQRATLVVK